MDPTLYQEQGTDRLRLGTHALKPLGEGKVEAIVSAFNITFTEGFFFTRQARISDTAFDVTLTEHTSWPIMWEHGGVFTPHGHTLEAGKVPAGLRAVSQLYIDSEQGRNLYRSIEAGAVAEWSIGFYPVTYETTVDPVTDEETRTYTQVDLVEISAALRGANPGTETLRVNSKPPASLRPPFFAERVAHLARLIGAEAPERIPR